MKENRVYSTFGSAVLTVSMSWFKRGMGILSIAILARLLSPDDFGVIAMATLVVALADVLLNFGVHVPLIQKQQATQSHYDSAWTLRLIQTSISTAALFLLAPVAADYFKDARVEPVLRCISFVLLAGGTGEHRGRELPEANAVWRRIPLSVSAAYRRIHHDHRHGVSIAFVLGTRHRHANGKISWRNSELLAPPHAAQTKFRKDSRDL